MGMHSTSAAFAALAMSLALQSAPIALAGEAPAQGGDATTSPVEAVVPSSSEVNTVAEPAPAPANPEPAQDGPADDGSAAGQNPPGAQAPSNPSEPAAPTAPTEPGDPADPATPASPTDPADPASPEDPATPADPNAPATPETTAPAAPTDPAAPATSADAADGAAQPLDEPAFDETTGFSAASLSYDPAAGTVNVRVEGVTCTSGVTFVSAGIYGPSGAVQWVRLAQDADGAWTASLSAASFGWASGTFSVSLFICDGAWAGVDLGSVSQRVSFGEASGSASLYLDDAGNLVVDATATCTSGIAFISAGLVSPSGSTTWVRLDLDETGSWKASLPLSSVGGETGTWSVGLYVCDAAWRGIAAGTSTCYLSMGNAAGQPALLYDAASDTVTVSAAGVSCTSGITFVSAALTSPSRSVQWVRLKQQDNATWAVGVPASQLGWNVGVWNVALYVCDSAWRGVEAGSANCSMPFGTAADSLATQTNIVAGSVVLSASGGWVDQAQNTSFMVVSSTGTTTWHQAYKNADGSWSATIGVSSLGGASCWAQTVVAVDGGVRYLTSAPFNITQSELGVSGAQTSVASEAGGESSIVSTTLDQTVYVFLPSNADATNVALSFVAQGVTSSMLVSASPTAGFTRYAAGSSIDLTTAAAASGANAYTLYVKRTATDQATRVCVMRSSGVSTMYLTSSDPVNEGRDYIESSADHSAKTTGSMTLVGADGSVAYNGELSQIKGRGNSTWVGADKRPYQIKLSSKASLVTGEKDEKSKTWVLLANAMDPTLLRNYVTFQTALALGLAGSTNCEFVDLYYDGEYRGSYLLSEKIEVGGARVDIDDLDDKNTTEGGVDADDLPTSTATNSYGNLFQYVAGVVEPDDISGGYLLELDNAYYASENSWFQTNFGTFVVKSPESSSEGEVAYISEMLQQAINVARDPSGDLKSYMDIVSLARTFLVQCLTKNGDYPTYSSTYFYKDAGDDLIYSGPVWDFDQAYGDAGDEEAPIDPSLGIDLSSPEGFGTEKLGFFFENSQFRAEVKKVFAEEFQPIVSSTLPSDIAQEASGLADSAAMNSVLWSSTGAASAQTSAASMASWVSTRLSWMNDEFTSDRW